MRATRSIDGASALREMGAAQARPGLGFAARVVGGPAGGYDDVVKWLRALRAYESALEARKRGDIDRLLLLLAAEGIESRMEAATALGRLAPPRAASALAARATGDPSFKVRQEAVRALGALPSATDETVQALRKAVGDEHEHVQFWALHALGRLRVREAIPLISDALRSHNDSKRFFAAVSFRE